MPIAASLRGGLLVDQHDLQARLVTTVQLSLHGHFSRGRQNPIN
jgi:hypothetical protein